MQCATPDCTNDVPPRKGGVGRMPMYCTRRCRNLHGNRERRRLQKVRAAALNPQDPDKPCTNVPCTCGRDYATLPL